MTPATGEIAPADGDDGGGHGVRVVTGSGGFYVDRGLYNTPILHKLAVLGRIPQVRSRFAAGENAEF
jgi:hypothetical protein